MRWQRWLLPVAIPVITALVVGGGILLAVKHRLVAELLANGDDMRIIAAYRDSTLLAPERSAALQQALHLQLTRPRPSPYRGSPTFVDSLGLWSSSEFLQRSRHELALLGAYQSGFVRRIEQVDRFQTLLFAAALLCALAIIPLLLLYRRDVRHRLRLLAKLQESEARYRELVEDMPDLIQSVDAQGRFVYVNRYWRQVMGYTPEELRQLRIWDILRPDQLPKCQALFERAFRDRQLRNVETVFITKNGEELIVSGNVTVRPDPVTGELVTRALFRDITEQRRQLELLRYQEALANTIARVAQQLLSTPQPQALLPSTLAQVAESLNADAVYLIALPDMTPQPIVLWARDEAAETALQQSFSPPCWSALRPLWERISAIAIVEATREDFAQADPNALPCLLQRNVQSLLWVPLTRTGQLWGFIGAEDWKTPRTWSPTERTALESLAASILSALDRVHAYQQLQRFAEDLMEARTTLEAYAEELRQANEELRERNAEKDRIMSIISHDLRSPLSGVRGLAELLQGDEAYNPEVVREFARLIYETTDHVLALVNDLLEVARIEAGRVRLHLAETDLCELARSAVRIMDGMARPKGISLHLECPDTPLYATVDAPKITQVINNLLSNAIKFTPSGGHVTVRLQPLPDGTVELQVEDTGIGIPAEHIPHLFEKFGPHQRAGTAGEKGTGLGMSIIKHFVELHGGTIAVESTPGVGTRFTIRLPRQPELATPPCPAADGSAQQ